MGTGIYPTWQDAAHSAATFPTGAAAVMPPNTRANYILVCPRGMINLAASAASAASVTGGRDYVVIFVLPLLAAAAGCKKGRRLLTFVVGGKKKKT
jgi:hypothetical protein